MPVPIGCAKIGYIFPADAVADASPARSGVPMNQEPWTIPLVHILRQRRWEVCTEPFPHVVAYDVFTPEFYAWLDHSFGEVMNRGLSEQHDPARFSRNIKNYDAYSITFTDEMPAPFQVFISREWHDMVARLTACTPPGISTAASIIISQAVKADRCTTI